jgi:hypothetical protein
MEKQNLAELNGTTGMDTLQQNGVSTQEIRLNFSDPTQREAHLNAFLAWLPQVLHQATAIQWDRLPSKVMGYLILSVADGPDAIPIALAIGCAMSGVKNSTLLSKCSQLTRLLKRLRARYGLRELAQLGTRPIWDQFAADRKLSLSELVMLGAYDALASQYVRSYLEGLDIRQRAIWEQYALPPLPAGFIDKQRQHKAALAATQQRRKEQSDVLVPLFPLLVEIAQLRKQAMERLAREFRKQRDLAIAGEIKLPYHFEYTDRLLAVSEDAPTLAEVRLIEREVTLAFTLWDRVHWVRDHPERYSDATCKTAGQRQGAYAPERNSYFLQFNGQAGDLLWCGEIIRDRRLGTVTSSKGKRIKEFYASRPGLLTPTLGESVWLNYALRSGEMLLDPESLYKGVLFATALATLALTNGSRLNELLQVSAERFDTLVVDELKDQLPTGRKIGILVQKLLPKGSRQEHERQFFLIGEMAGRLLTEIGQLLESAHGGTIPVVHPYRNSKEEDLGPEPYLFQWAADVDGRLGVLNPDDVGRLLRFLFHGLTLMTRTGKPIRVAPHLLRHVLATHARTVKKVPAEAVAYLLHHRVVLPDSTRALTISEATAYYSRLPLEQLLALLYEAQSQLSPQHPPSYLQVPPPRTLEQMDAALRQVFEQWGTIGPTVFGYCSAGLCVRPNNRALCLDCQYLVPHYSNLSNARTWRKLYVLQAQLHDAHGHSVDAKQARQMIQYIDDIIRVMEIQIRARQDAGILPFAETLPPPAQDEEGEEQQWT